MSALWRRKVVGHETLKMAAVSDLSPGIFESERENLMKKLLDAVKQVLFRFYLIYLTVQCLYCIKSMQSLIFVLVGWSLIYVYTYMFLTLKGTFVSSYAQICVSGLLGLAKARLNTLLTIIVVISETKRLFVSNMIFDMLVNF